MYLLTYYLAPLPALSVRPMPSWMTTPPFGFPDAQALSRNYAPGKLAIGQSVTRGLGAGGVPSVGRKAAEESMDDLSECASRSRIIAGATFIPHRWICYLSTNIDTCKIVASTASCCEYDRFRSRGVWCGPRLVLQYGKEAFFEICPQKHYFRPHNPTP